MAIGIEENRANLQRKCRPSVQRGAIGGIPELDRTVDRAHGDEAFVRRPGQRRYSDPIGIPFAEKPARALVEPNVTGIVASSEPRDIAAERGRREPGEISRRSSNRLRASGRVTSAIAPGRLRNKPKRLALKTHGQDGSLVAGPPRRENLGDFAVPEFEAAPGGSENQVLPVWAIREPRQRWDGFEVRVVAQVSCRAPSESVPSRFQWPSRGRPGVRRPARPGR